MSEAARSRYALDLDEIERQIREASSRPAVQGQSDEDPLAELARIVSGNGRIRPEPASIAKPQNVAPVTPHDLNQVVAREFGGAHAARHGAQEPALGLEQDIEALLARSDSLSQQTAVNYDEFAEAMRSFEQVIAEPRVQAAASQELMHHNANASAVTAPAEAVAHAYGQETYQQSYHPAPAQHEQPVDFQRELSDMMAAQTQAQQAPEAPAFAHGIPEPEPEFYPAYANTAEPLAPRRSRRKSMMLVAAVVGVAAVGVGGALSFRGKGGIQASGEPPLIRAAEGPSKIAPANPGGTDVPDQNRQILERSAPKTAATPPKVVASDEQPLDLKEAVRKEAASAPAEAQGTAGSPRVILSSPLPIPPAGSTVEPRKVKTVVIRPPGAPASPAAEPAAPPAALTPPPPPVRTASLPPKPAEPIATAAVPAPAVATPSTPPAAPAQVAKPKPKPVAETKPVQARPATPVAPANTSNDDPVATGTAPMSIVPSGQPKRNQRLPQQAAVAAPAAVQSDAQPAAASGGGGFVVQLSSEGSDAEARSSAARFKSRFGELGDFGSSIQRRDVNGQTRYRVRFGSMSREDANELCSSLKGKGQACIVQPN